MNRQTIQQNNIFFKKSYNNEYNQKNNSSFGHGNDGHLLSDSRLRCQSQDR